jgi:hypothetical protein
MGVNVSNRRIIYTPPGGGGGESTVLFDSSGHYPLSSSGVTSNNFVGGGGGTVNVGSGSNGTTNLCLLGILQSTQNIITSPALTWDPSVANQSMTLIPGAADANQFWFYLMVPVLGSKSVTATWTGAAQTSLYMISFVGVDQTGGATTFPSPVTNSGSTSIPTINIAASPTTRKIAASFSSPTTNFSTTTSTPFVGSPENTGNVNAVAAAWDNGPSSSISYNPSSGSWAAIGLQIKGA